MIAKDLFPLFERGAELGVDLVAPSSGAAWIDVDEDGDLDLYVTTVGDTRHYLLVQEGGVFSEQGLARGAALESMYLHAGMTPTPGDYDLDGFLDLYVAEWRKGTIIYGGTDHARLLHNRGALGPGTFEDATVAAGVGMDVVDNTLGPQVFGPALVTSTSTAGRTWRWRRTSGSTRLFWNAGDGTFAVVYHLRELQNTISTVITRLSQPFREHSAILSANSMVDFDSFSEKE